MENYIKKLMDEDNQYILKNVGISSIIKAFTHHLTDINKPYIKLNDNTYFLPESYEEILSHRTLVHFQFDDKFSNNLIQRMVDEILFSLDSQSLDNLKEIIFVVPFDFDNAYTSYLKGFFKSQYYFADKEITFWDLDKLNSILSTQQELFKEIYLNYEDVFIQNKVQAAIEETTDDWITQRDIHIQKLSSNFIEDNVVLFTGAGMSYDAKIPTWNELISDMFLSLIENNLNESHDLKSNRNTLLNEFIKINNGAPLLQARFIRTGLEKKFKSVLTNVMYKNCINNSEVLQQLTKLCVPLRNGTGIHAVINYNFDDLLEYNFDQADIRYKAIYKEADIPTKNELGIYHVHGFLPRDTEKYVDIDKSLLVFSEEGYHDLYLDPYHWSNLVQLQFLKEKTCLFAGLSMTDPNLRRLLDISYRKSNSKKKHYAIMKRELMSLEGVDTSVFNHTSISIQEDYFKDIGVNIIWVDEYREIPDILSQIRKCNI